MSRRAPVGAAGGMEPVARLRDISLRYGRTCALDAVSLDVPAGCMAGLIGPDGVGKSSVLSLIAGARAVQAGRIEVLGGDIAEVRHRPGQEPVPDPFRV
ncbi:MAG: multidrug transporter ATP-binding protein [Deltaproteobacteria bacterium]|nr:multidrug transporter ATP-binding protein [Deltaproteobacteria bacterium]